MITYRRAEPSDLDLLVTSRISFLMDSMGTTDDAHLNLLKETLTTYFEKHLEERRFISWLAFDEDLLVATSGLCFYTLPPSLKNPTGKVAYVMNMYTKPEYRNKGIAKALFEKVVKEARELGYKKICLHATEMGRPVYEKFGFRQTNNEMVWVDENIS